MPELRCGIVLSAPRARVFEFFGDAFNLERITPPWLNFEILTPAPVAMGVGTILDYRIRLHGVPMRWRTKITRWDQGVAFVDEQIRGPYFEWVHLHTFEDREDGTWCEDLVRYRVPGGALVHAAFVKHQLLRVFGYRQRVMADLFGVAPGSERVAPTISSGRVTAAAGS